MKERFRELAFEAAGGMLSYGGEDEWRLSQKEAEKFAELIVRECIDIIDEEGSHEGGSIRSMEKIREHFGVEE